MSNLSLALPEHLDQRVIRSQIRALLEYGVDLADALAESANAAETQYYRRVAGIGELVKDPQTGMLGRTAPTIQAVKDRALWMTLCAQRDRIAREAQRVKDLLQRLQEILGILLDDYPAAIRYVEETRQQIGKDEFGSEFPIKQRDRSKGEYPQDPSVNLVKSPTFIGTYDHN